MEARVREGDETMLFWRQAGFSGKVYPAKIIPRKISVSTKQVIHSSTWRSRLHLKGKGMLEDVKTLGNVEIYSPRITQPLAKEVRGEHDQTLDCLRRCTTTDVE
ncbi:hypothetical protein ACLOJK_033269 [Asimina triloba]